MLSGDPLPSVPVQVPEAFARIGSDEPTLIEAWSYTRDLGVSVPGVDETVLSTGRGEVLVAPEHPLVVTGVTPWKTGTDASPALSTVTDLEVSVSGGAPVPVAVGRVDSVSAGMWDGLTAVGLVDMVDDLSKPLLWDPLHEKMPPLGEGAPYRRIGLCNAYVVDRALRDCGYGSTPIGEKPALDVPMVGSLMPRVGLLHYTDDYFPVPASRQGMPQGVVLKSVSAVYQVDSASLYNFTVSMEVDTSTTTAGFVRWWLIDHQGKDGKGYLFRYSQESRQFTVWHATSSGTDPSAGELLVTLTLTDADHRVTTRVRGSGSSAEIEVQARVSGKIATSSTVAGSWVLDHATWWRATVATEGDGVAGAFLIDDPAVPFGPAYHSPQVEMGWTWAGINRLYATPRLKGDITALELLRDAANAELAAVGFDELGRVFFRTWGWMVTRPLSRVFTASDVVDFGWSVESSSVRSTVAVKRSHPIRLARRFFTVLLWQGPGEALEPDENGTIEMSPDAGVDWLKIDADWTRLGYGEARLWNLRRGSWFGAARVVDTDDADPYEQWAYGTPGDRIWFTTYPLEDDGTTLKLDYSVSGWLGDSETIVLKGPDLNDTAYKGLTKDLPILRGMGKTRWLEKVLRPVKAGPSSAPALEHDCSWFVQHVDDLTRVRDRIVKQVSAARPRVTSVRVAPDVRVQVGDRVQVVDDRPGGTGAAVEGLVSRKHVEGGPGSLEMTIDLVQLVDDLAA